MQNMKFNIYLLVSIFWILNNNYGYCKDIRKRQIYREQVLPHAGGKIPDTAFETDRLALNRLQKDGIAVPDGIILQQRNPQVYQYSHKAIRPVFKVSLTSDNRYTPSVGQYHYSHPAEQPSIETTYSIPQYVNHNGIIPKIIVAPVHKTFVLPNSLLKGHPSPHNIQPILTSNKHGAVSSSRITLYPNYQLSHNNIQNYDFGEISNNNNNNNNALSLTPQNKFYEDHNYDYVSSNLFNDFESFFNTFTNHITHLPSSATSSSTTHSFIHH